MVAATATGAAAGLSGLAAGPLGLDPSTLMPERSALEILSGEVRVRLGGQDYVLPVLSIAANRRWKATLEGSLVGLLDQLELEGDLSGILAVFATATDQLLAALYGYDTSHVLPPQAELEEVATDSEVLLATLGVWSAANPFAGVALGVMRNAEQTLAPQTSASSQPTNGAPQPTAGARRSSRRS